MSLSDELQFEKQRDRLLEIISEKMNVKNPTLMKTGTIATFANIVQHLQQDSKNFYTQLLRELNPALAQDFSSLVFHAAVEDVNLNYAQGALLDINILIPELNLRSSEMYTYTILKGTQVLDNNKLIYTFDANVVINLGSGTSSAKEYSQNGVKTLSVKRVPHPDQETSKVYLINYPRLRQYRRIFLEFNVDNMEFFSTHIYKNNLQDINAWLITADQINDDYFYLNTDQLQNKSSENIATFFNWKPLNIKTQKYTSEYGDDDIFMDIREDLIYLIPGDNVYGKKLPEGSKLIVEIQQTEGLKGNVVESTFDIGNVISEFSVNGIKNTDDQELKTFQGISIKGSNSGKNFDTNEEIKGKILDAKTTRKSINSFKDYETFFKIENSKPFVTSKYFNSRTHVFIYNVLKDKNEVVKTTTMNILEDDLKANSFLPEMMYNNEQNLISPFYYKQTTNGWKAFIINPKVRIGFQNQEFDNSLLITLNNVEVYLMYDFETSTSYIQLENMNTDFVYIINSNIQQMTLDEANNFRVDISKSYLDPNCLCNEPMKNISITINKDDEQLVTLYSDGSFFQLEKIQTNYLYYELDKFNTNEETIYVLNLPYVDKQYFVDTDNEHFYDMIKSFFKIKENEHMFSFNHAVNQLFYNTIDVQEKYLPYIIEENDNGIALKTENPIIINLILNKEQFIQYGFTTTSEFEFQVIRDIIPVFLQVEGFYTKFYESNVELYLKDVYYNLIDNVRVVFPEMFIIKSNSEIHDLMEEDMVQGSLTIKDTLDFTPPYFYFDYNSISINIKFK